MVYCFPFYSDASLLHIKWFQSDKWEYVGEILALDFAFVSVALGMTTYEAIKKNNQPKE